MSSVNVTEFKAQLKGFEKSTEKQTVTVQKKATLQILRGVIRANPVDTGRMRSAWTVSVGAPSSDDPSRSVIGAGGSALSAAVGLSGLKFGQATYVVNNVEYSGHVNNHHPTKAGFVQAVVSNVESQFAIGPA